MVAAQVCKHSSEMRALFFDIIYIQPLLNILPFEDTYVGSHMEGPNIPRMSERYSESCRISILVKYFSDVN